MKNLIKDIPKKFFPVILANIGSIALVLIYVLLRFQYLNELIPFWYTKPWGEAQLAPKISIFLIPLTGFFIALVCTTFITATQKKFLRYGGLLVLLFMTLCNMSLVYSVIRIIKIASTPYKPLIDPRLVDLLWPILFSAAVTYLIAPKIIKKLKEKGIVTNPQVHKHPGMLLSKPSVRGGGVIFATGTIIACIFLVKLSAPIIGLLISMSLAACLGILDDIQNTIPKPSLAWIEKPSVRFALQAIAALPILFVGIQINFISNPLNGVLRLNSQIMHVGNIYIAPIAVLLTLLWVIWIMNTLSWSNGVDGQYSGIVGIAAVVIAIIASRYSQNDPTQINTIKVAAVVAGASFGLLPYTWNPSKVMWGFGATSAGITIAALSIITGAKIATAMIVLLIPFFDGVVTIVRRIVQKRSPFKGDRGHLHHILLDRGWSIKKVAIFYWLTTAVSGTIGILSANKDPALTALTLAGLAAFFIILLNVKKRNST